jgi:hypothetical protein
MSAFGGKADMENAARIHTMKIDKSEAHYGRGTQKEHCGHSYPGDQNFCRHFIEPYTPPNSDTGTCTEVSGAIGRIYWCKLWSKARAG